MSVNHYITHIISIIFLGNSSSDIEDGENDICDYEANFAKYKQRVKAEEHYFYNSVVDDSLSGSNDSDN